MKLVATGELAGSASAAVFPNVAGTMAYIKAVASNAGKVYVGLAGVTVVNGSTDVTSGYELSPGDEVRLPLAGTLAALYRICDNAGDDVTYMVFD